MGANGEGGGGGMYVCVVHAGSPPWLLNLPICVCDSACVCVCVFISCVANKLIYAAAAAHACDVITLLHACKVQLQHAQADLKI